MSRCSFLLWHRFESFSRHFTTKTRTGWWLGHPSEKYESQFCHFADECRVSHVCDPRIACHSHNFYTFYPFLGWGHQGALKFLMVRPPPGWGHSQYFWGKKHGIQTTRESVAFQNFWAKMYQFGLSWHRWHQGWFEPHPSEKWWSSSIKGWLDTQYLWENAKLMATKPFPISGKMQIDVPNHQPVMYKKPTEQDYWQHQI